MPHFQVLRRYVFVFGLILNLILSSCVTAPKLNQPKTSKTRLEQQTSKIEKVSPINESRIRTKLKTFKRALKKGKLSKKDWELHDELLEAYIQLKSQQSNKVTVPAHSQKAFPLETYCLNSGKAAPSKQEIYHWQKSDPGIKYYKKLLDLRRKNKIKQQDLQELLWNLQNETRWNDYPNRLKAILQSIDSQASLKLPSNLKDQATSLVTDSLLDLPGASEALDTYNLLKGHYYDFETFKNSVENLASKHELSDYQNLTKIPNTNLYSQSQSNGFDNQTVTLFNPTNQPQEINLNEYYLAPERPDVQRIGINRSIDDPSLLTDLEKVLYDDMARLGIGFVPFLGDVADLYELFYGKDFASNKRLSFDERLASGAGVILGSGSAYRYAKRWINSPTKYLPKFEEGIAEIGKKAIESPNYVNAKHIVQEGNSKAIELSKNLDYNGTKELSNFLRDKGVDRKNRVQTVKSFDSGSIMKRILEKDEVVYRWHNNDDSAQQLGRYVSPEKILDRGTAKSQLALPVENKMKYLDEFTLKKGTTVFEGRVAPYNGSPGGVQQILVPGDINHILKFKQRIK